MSARIEGAQLLHDEIRALLDAADLETVIVSLDPNDLPAGRRDGIVLIEAPEIEFVTFTIFEAAYQLGIAVGDIGDVLSAWRRLDLILHALQGLAVGVKSARPDSFTVKDVDGPMPGYTVTLHPLTIQEGN